MPFKFIQQITGIRKDINNGKGILLQGAGEDNNNQPRLTNIEALFSNELPDFKNEFHSRNFSRVLFGQLCTTNCQPLHSWSFRYPSNEGYVVIFDIFYDRMEIGLKHKHCTWYKGIKSFDR